MRVPVLSERITVVQPRVSTDESCLIIAFFPASLWTPNARAIVIVAGRPSGTAATATEMVNIKLSTNGFPCKKNPITKRVTDIINVINATKRPINFSSFWSGDWSCFVVAVKWVILPNSVLSPVAKTIALPSPWVIMVPMKTMFFCSIFGRYFPLRATTSFPAGSDSPVSIDWSHSNWLASISRASAGTRVPSVKIMMSPGTSRNESISTCLPSLKTLA